MSVRSKKVSHSTLIADREALKALSLLSDYQPSNPLYSRENLLLLEQTLTQAEIAEARLDENFERVRADRDAGRNVRKDTQLALHNAVLGFKDQVIAQYGDDSYAMKAIGLTRKSERKQGVRRKTSS